MTVPSPQRKRDLMCGATGEMRFHEQPCRMEMATAVARSTGVMTVLVVVRTTVAQALRAARARLTNFRLHARGAVLL